MFIDFAGSASRSLRDLKLLPLDQRPTLMANNVAKLCSDMRLVSLVMGSPKQNSTKALSCGILMSVLSDGGHARCSDTDR